MKKALVLAGGGTKGIYQIGALKALKELGKDDYNMVFGVSVGALNAVMIAQGDIEEMVDMYEHLQSDQIVDGYVPTNTDFKTLVSESKDLLPQVQRYLKEGSFDVHPFYDMVDKYYHPDRLFASDMDFGCVTALKKDHSGVYVTKDMMKEHGRDWLIASASAYPVFPTCTIDDVEYVDGGYFDNCPIDFALRRGAEEVIVIDLGADPLHPLYVNQDFVRYIHPHKDLYAFLVFDREQMEKARLMGYNDTMKVFGRYTGQLYTFQPFALPEFFTKYMRYLMILESRIKSATNINERFRSDAVITTRLKAQLHTDTMTTRKYFYGILESIMSMLEMDELAVWDYEDAAAKIKEQFADAMQEDFEYRPSFAPNKLAAYIRSFDEKSLVTYLVHANMYPDHIVIPENIMLTVYPFEMALAMFITLLLKEDYEYDCEI